MCGISGFCDFTTNLRKKEETNRKLVEDMGKTIVHRGPDSFGTYIGDHVAFAHTRLAVMDPKKGTQPMIKRQNGNTYVIVYNGELYNTKEIKEQLEKKGSTFFTTSDTEVLLEAYMVYGRKVVDYLNGIYSFMIWDEKNRSCFFCRDRFGVKPLFYTIQDGRFFFASEMKALFAHPDIKPKVNAYGLCEIFGLGPARSTGNGVYEGIHEVPPGYCGIFDYNGIKLYCYWKLEARKHEENYEETVAHVREILFDAIERQLISDVPLCTLLSGGLDSSIISAVSANVLKEKGKKLDTYSFDFLHNSEYFKASQFQPDQDRPFVDKMIESIKTKHHYLECEYQELYQCLFDAVKAKDLPGMADVDSSMLYFARKIKKNHTVCLSGECADEVFGGYPWFRDQESYERQCFPWSKDLSLRKMILGKEMKKKLPLEEYINCQYQKTMDAVSLLEQERETISFTDAMMKYPGQVNQYFEKTWCNLFEEVKSGKIKESVAYAIRRRQREISYLNTSWFMTTLLDRKDRMTMASGLEVRVPFADHRLIQYLYNVPWEYKYHNGEVKGLLKDAVKDLLPKEVIWRKKCPYPKTYDPKYENLLKSELKRIVEDSDAPLHILVDSRVLKEMMEHPSDYGKPWFGQLMALPQMYAYLIEINDWLERYQVEITI